MRKMGEGERGTETRINMEVSRERGGAREREVRERERKTEREQARES